MPIRKRQILVPLYFFLGGLAGGSFVIAVAAHFAYDSTGHPLVLRGFAISFPLLLISAVILTVDLTQPLRFWRLFTRVKLISPISTGSWALAAFGIFAAAAWAKIFIAALGPYLPPALVRWILALPFAVIEWLGLPVALFVASYTGVLLNTSARPVWASQPVLGGLFFASALATSVALLGGWTSAEQTITRSTLHKLLAIERLLLAVQLALTAAFVAMALKRVGWENPRLRALLAGPLSGLFHGSWIIGVLLPLVVWTVPALRTTGVGAGFTAVLVGGLAMRYAIFLCEEPGG